MFFGLAIILLGVIFLLNSLGIISGDTWNIIWPSLLIIIGASILVKDMKKESRCKSFEDKIADRIFRDRE